MSLTYEVTRYMGYITYLKFCRHGQNHHLYRPSVVYSDEDVRWMQYGEYHRVGAPAILYSDRKYSYYTRGRCDDAHI